MPHEELKQNLNRYCYAEISLKNFAYNINLIKSILPANHKILCVLKANAYGHGARELAKVALENGIYELGVATLSEAISLRELYKDAKILILGYTPKTLIEEAIKHDIELCVYHKDIALEISKIAKRLKKIAKIHIKLDTGMGRIGYLCDNQSLDEIESISKLDSINIAGIFTHFSSADELDSSYTKRQFSLYQSFIKELNKRGISGFIRHCSNSAGIFSYKDAILDMSRIGIIAYGIKPMREFSLELKPVMSLKARIVHIKSLPKDSAISYGRKFITQKPSIIATLPIGYADGYMRLLSNKAEVLLKGKRARVVGNICMDQCCIDISHIKKVRVGDEVVLFGKDEFDNEISTDELARHIGTISYEIICAISLRVPRIYIN